MTGTTPPLFVLAPRYARDLGTMLAARGVGVEMVRHPGDAAAALARSAATVAVVDARGAVAATMLAAREIGTMLDGRRGAMLVLLARGDTGAVAAARAAGATQVLASPFGATELIEAIGFAAGVATRLATVDGDRPHGTAQPPRDPLTGLANAGHALEWLRGLLDDGRVPSAAALLIGVDRFAAINATHGQTAADALLQAVAERLTRVVGEHGGGEQLVARMAGAEFAVILPAPMAPGDALMLAREIVAAFERPFASNARIVHLSLRIGIAVAERDAGPGAEARLFRQAGAALAAARSGAPGAIEIFRGDGGGDPLARLADLETDLRRAIVEGDFEIAFQPQVVIATGAIAGVEALVRWHHPVFGPLPAETLLEIAANADFGPAFGASIRGKALREAQAWPAALAALQLSVNVTAGDLRAPDFADVLETQIAASGFAAERLTLEITESDLIENLDAAAEMLAALRRAGIAVALDDFGTGYSSLAYLKALPLDALKLDRRLTRDLAGGQRDRVVVRVVVALARALGIRVVAEGVETAAELALVAAARCDWYQGYLCAPAMATRELVAFVEGWQRRDAA